MKPCESMTYGRPELTPKELALGLIAIVLLSIVTVNSIVDLGDRNYVFFVLQWFLVLEGLRTEIVRSDVDVTMAWTAP